MKQLSCGIIGCGRIGCAFDESDGIIKTHAGAYTKNPLTKLVSICDIDKNKVKKYGEKFNVKNLYTNSAEMLKNERLDCVSICTLIDSHLGLIKEASKYNIPGIFLEKPMSNSIKNTKEIIDICKKKNITLVIDHQRRFDPFYHSIKKFISQKNMGSVKFVHVYYGGGIVNTGTHIFDVLRLFFGECGSIKSTQSKNMSGNKLDPNLDIILEFVTGVVCYINAVDIRNYNILEMDIIGTRGRLMLNLASDTVNYFQVSKKKFCSLQETNSQKN